MRRRLLWALLGGAGAALAQATLWRLQRMSGDPVPWLWLLGLGGSVALLLASCAPALPHVEEPLPEPPSLQPTRRLVWWSGLAALVSGSLVAWYGWRGYQPFLVVLWLASWVMATMAVWAWRAPRRPEDLLDASERRVLGCLIGLGGVLYLAGVSRIPYLINWDEVSQAAVVRTLRSPSANLFGVHPNFWGLPVFEYWLSYRSTLLFGDSVTDLRIPVALVGMLTLLPCYRLARCLFGKRTATVATLLLACSHVYVGWSRTRLQCNSSLLVGTTAFFLLMQGLTRACPVRLLWGGLVLAIGFYGYQPSRVFVLVWVVFLAAAWLLKRLPTRQLRFASVMSLCGLVLGIAPMAVTMAREPALCFQRLQAISGWDLLHRLEGTPQLAAQAAAFQENAVRNMLVFNSSMGDAIHYHPAFGMLDPISGVLLWIGVALAWSRWRRLGDVLAALGLMVIWVVGGFLTDRAPAYGRLIALLPFLMLLCARGLEAVGSLVLLAYRRASSRLLWVPVALILGWNLAVVGGYMQDQRRASWYDPITSIGRYLLERPDGYANVFVLVSPADQQLFPWQWGASRWIVDVFTGAALGEVPERVKTVTSVEPVMDPAMLPPQRPLTMFMTGGLWGLHRKEFLARYPSLQVRQLSPEPSIMAVTVP